MCVYVRARMHACARTCTRVWIHRNTWRDARDDVSTSKCPGKRNHSLPTHTVSGASNIPHAARYKGNVRPTAGHMAIGAEK